MADSRDCEQRGTSFAPRREHARFCCARCRAAWNREHMGYQQADASAPLLPSPALASLPPRAQAWERTRYQAYYAQLAGHTLGEVFRRAATFLTLAAANAGPANASSHADGQVPNAPPGPRY